MLTLVFKKSEQHNDVKEGSMQSGPIFDSYSRNVAFTCKFFEAIIFWSEMHFCLLEVLIAIFLKLLLAFLKRMSLKLLFSLLG